MRTLAVPVVGQHLSEVDVVIRPNRSLFFCIYEQAFIVTLRYGSIGIAVVTVAIAFLDVTAKVNAIVNVVLHRIDAFNAR